MLSPLGFRSSLLRAARMMSDNINTLLLPHKLNYSLWQVLYVIQQMQGCTSIEIAEYLNVSKPSIAKRIQSLIQLDVLQHIETADKREKKFILSSYGQQLFLHCSNLIDQFEQYLTQHLSTDALGQTTQLLNQLTSQLENVNLEHIHE